MTTEVQLPASAVADGDAGDDIVAPTTTLLHELNLLGTDAELAASEGLSGTFQGSVASVAVIEASATALSKWWSAGLGAAAVGASPVVWKFWSDALPATQRVIAIGLAIAVAAVVLAIGYIVGSDVRGRSAAAVATIEARARIATTMLELAERSYRPSGPDGSPPLVAMPAALRCKNLTMPARDEGGWAAIALIGSGEKTQYLLVKDTRQHLVAQSSVSFDGLTSA